MDAMLNLAAPHGVQLLLKSVPEASRRRGQSLFNRDRVFGLSAIESGLEFTAVVEDDGEYEVNLRHDEEEETWRGECACGSGVCEHVFAAGSALLAEHRTAVVRQLSGTLAQTLGAEQRPGPKPLFQAKGLDQQLAEAIGRPLNRRESDFIRKLRSVYQQYRRTRQIGPWDLYNLGIASPRDIFQEDVWPSMPTSEHEFWLYLARWLSDQEVALPPYMLPVTNLDLIQNQVAQWQRKREVQRWLDRMQKFELRSGPAYDPLQEPADAQLVVDGRQLSLAWRAPGAPDFVACRASDYRRLAAGYESGLAHFTDEGEFIWRFFNQVVYGHSADLSHSDYGPGRIKTAFGRLLRIPALQSRIVTAEGQPLERVAEPLRWTVIPPETEQDNYRLRLTQVNDVPLPKFIAILPGNPALYLTPTAVFRGPDTSGTDLEISKENLIPTAALESSAGVAFLRSLGVELPGRIRERMRLLKYHPRIKCELVNSYGREECAFEVEAETEDGQRRSWTGFNWVNEKSRPTGAAKLPPDVIVVHDAADLQVIPDLLAPLNLKTTYDRSYLAMRITGKFAERFTEWLATVPPQVEVALGGELASLACAEVAGSVKLDVTETEIDWFDLRVVLNVSDTTLSPQEVKLLLGAKGKFVRLEGKGWRRLRFELSEEENERLARLGLNPRELSNEPQRLHALQLADEAARKFLPAEQVDQIQRRAGEIKARVTPDLPKGITAQMRPYQSEGFHFLAYLSTNHFGGILADDMGLGKTLQTLAWLLWLREQPATPSAAEPANGEPVTLPPALVVCPKSVVDNWHAEAARFAPELRVRPWTASELERLPGELHTADVHVVNYSQLRLLGESLVPIRWLAVILDEGQYIKNPSSQTAQIARALRAQHRLVLSGTPIENRLLDLWSLMSFAMPGALGSRAQFARTYDAKGDPFARRRLAARVRPFVLRRTKSQVAKDLPDRVEEDLFCEIEGEQKTLYRAELKKAQALLLGIQTQKELAQFQFHFLTSLLRLRQICCHPRLVGSETSADSAKTEALLEQLEPLMEEGHKVLVFSQFVEMLDLLRPALEERKWPVFYLAGHTENRGELVREFQSKEGEAVFLISLKAGGFGLNLTAASYVVLFDPWWNPAVEAQAIDRTHRIGQTQKVMAYRLLIKDSIEGKIRDLQKKKKALAEDVLGEEKFAQSLTLDDLRFLFAD